MSSAAELLREARAALEKTRPHLPAATAAALEQRLKRWEEQTKRQSRPAAAMPELVMRPGLPPRPLNKHYVTVIRSYE